MRSLDEILDIARDEGLSDTNVDAIREATTPAVRLQLADSGRSRLGGVARLPKGVPWPVWDATESDARTIEHARAALARTNGDYWKERVAALENREARSSVPLSFMAHLDLRDVRGLEHGLPLPDDGHLFFFYELSEQPWGYDPSHRGSFRVLHASGHAELEERPPPDGAETLKGSFVSVEETWTAPRWLSLEDDEDDLYDAFLDRMEDDAPGHQVGGAPDQIQGEMPEACAIVSQGVYLGGTPDVSEEEIARLEKQAPEWQLLLQLTSDERLDWMWGDLGNLYWWMRETDIREGNWDAAWFQLQCH